MPRRLPVFPLGTVLVPHGVLPLHIFEPRYRTLMRDLLGAGDEEQTPPGAEAHAEPEMGVVLIERGREVGGGEERSKLGTLARVLHAGRFPDGRLTIVVAGLRRFTVQRWLPDDPYPLAEVEELALEQWDPSWEGALHTAERAVRRAAALASELGETRALPSLSQDPLVASWQLCAAVPVGPFDRQRLLASTDTAGRLALLAEQADEVADILAFRLGSS